jgi:hypothetical protein
MHHIGTVSGTGWLRTGRAGSSTASYDVSILRKVTGPHAGDLVGKGRVACDLWTLAEARSAGRAELVLTNGDSVTIRLLSIDDGEASFVVLGRVPKF